ncbi:MAG: lipid-A-disaccharide synthase [Rhodanobacteraceae bacterium]
MTTRAAPRFGLVAGEASGDVLGAGLIDALRERFPEASFAGIGGARMIAAGLDAWYPMEKLSVMGLVEVLRHLPDLLALRRNLLDRARAWRPDVFIGIDAPDFNLGVERKLRKTGIATVHYVSPSIWAWREKRADKIGRSADRVLCLFPMEPAIYTRHGVDARFVGHPLARRFAIEPDRMAARRTLGLPADVPTLAMLPGSRLDEINRLGADFLGAARLLAREIAGLHIVAPMANAACRAAFETIAREAGFDLGNGTARATSDLPALRILDGNAEAAMVASDAVLVASGTATLEAMLAKRPMVVAYRLHPWTYRLVRAFGLLKIEHVSLPNVLAGYELVPELMQDACTPAALAAALRAHLTTREPSPALLQEYRRLHEGLRGDADHAAAAAIAELID